jgi:hypothetical protein
MGIINSTFNSCWGRVYGKPESLDARGVKPDVFHLISKIANYSPNIVFDIDGEIYDTDVFFQPYLQRTFSDGYFHTTTSFYESKIVIITTPGELYTSYEKLLLPFDATTWKYLMISFVLAFVAILVINRLPLVIRKSIFSKSPTVPALNAVSTFYGIPQLRLPINHVPRYVLILCVFFCLIFRTCYQSKIFEFMTSDPRRPPPKTVQDLIDNDFELYWSKGTLYEDDEFLNDTNHW